MIPPVIQEDPTEFAPSERVPKEEILRQAQTFAQDPLLCEMLDGIPEVVLVLNKARQIVFTNKCLLDFLGIAERDSICGFRPGEALRCVHAEDSHTGCGTTEFCGTCGAVTAILSSLHGHREIQECRIIQRDTGEPMDLRVCTSPFFHHNDRYTLFTVSDISHEKRRKALERTFFHDVLNTAGALLGYAELLQEIDDPAAGKGYKEDVYRLANTVVDEINSHKILSAAESNDLSANKNLLSSLKMLREGSNLFRKHKVSQKREIKIDPKAEEFEFISDRTLLRRIIANMVKNALEACEEGMTVTIGCRSTVTEAEFWVHNPTFMPYCTQLQLFKRSFSTKGVGRGLGTYSMKLLGEKFLGGSVSFTSSEDEGTTFRIWLPKNGQE